MEIISSVFHYFFNARPGTEFKFYVPMIILISALVIGAIVFGQIYKRRKRSDVAFKKLFQKLSGRMTLMATLFTLLVAIRHENILYFSMRIWLYLSILLLILLGIYYLRLYKVKYPEKKHNQEKRLTQTSPDQHYSTTKRRR